MERENHNATMDRNEISFLRLTAMSGLSNFNLVFIEIHISSEQQKGWALCKMSIVRRVASEPADVILVVVDTCTRPWQTHNIIRMRVYTHRLFWIMHEKPNECFKKLTRFSELSFVPLLTEQKQIASTEIQWKFWFIWKLLLTIETKKAVGNV